MESPRSVRILITYTCICNKIPLKFGHFKNHWPLIFNQDFIIWICVFVLFCVCVFVLFEAFVVVFFKPWRDLGLDNCTNFQSMHPPSSLMSVRIGEYIWCLLQTHPTSAKAWVKTWNFKAVWKHYRKLQYLRMSILMWEYYFIIKIDLTFTNHAIEWIKKASVFLYVSDL